MKWWRHSENKEDEDSFRKVEDAVEEGRKLRAALFKLAETMRNDEQQRST